MLTETLSLLFDRDLNKLKSEISAYADESKIWIVDKKIANSSGNLTLHLVGNLNTYIGAVLGNSGYIRNRELEFAAKAIKREELIRKIEDTNQVVKNTLQNIKDEMLQNEFPLIVWDEPVSVEYMLVHLATHLNWHLGQVNYHRRLLDA